MHKLLFVVIINKKTVKTLVIITDAKLLTGLIFPCYNRIPQISHLRIVYRHRAKTLPETVCLKILKGGKIR